MLAPHSIYLRLLSDVGKSRGRVSCRLGRAEPLDRGSGEKWKRGSYLF